MVKVKAASDQCWLSVKLLHHLGLNWIFPRIVQWRFGRDLSWVAYSHLNVKFIMITLITPKEKEKNAHLCKILFVHLCPFQFLCYIICLKAGSCSMISMTNCRHPQIPLSTAIPSSFSPSTFSSPNIFPGRYLKYLSISTRSKISHSQFIQRMSTCQEKRHLPAQSQSQQDHYQHTWGSNVCCSRWSGLEICPERYISENLPPDSPVLRPGVWIRINRHQRFSVKSRFPALVVRVQPDNPTVRGDERGLPENANWRKETKCFRFGVVLRPPRRTTWWLL